MMPVARTSELRAGKGALFQAAFQAGPHSGQALKSGFAGGCRSTISREAPALTVGERRRQFTTLS